MLVVEGSCIIAYHRHRHTPWVWISSFQSESNLKMLEATDVAVTLSRRCNEIVFKCCS